MTPMLTWDLPLIWAAILAVAVLMYVMLDGFDLGIGLLFPFAGSPAERDVMMSSVAPVWDGNETWLVLGGGGLFAAFPVAYAALMPALYVPILAMLMGLILRGAAFEFRLNGRHHGKRLWTIAFTAGSFTATFAQGLVLGGFIQGVTLRNQVFAGGPLDWLTPYSLLTATGLVAGYALLGAGWLMIKTTDNLHGDARRWAAFAAGATAVLLAAVSLATLFVHPQVAAGWGIGGDGVDWAKLAPRAAIPLLGLAGLIVVGIGLRRRSHWLPFAGALVVFLSGYLGLAVSFFPNIVPYDISFRRAANAQSALELLTIGIAIIGPFIASYTVFVYWLFRGKVQGDAAYH